VLPRLRDGMSGIRYASQEVRLSACSLRAPSDLLSIEFELSTAALSAASPV